MNDEIVNDQIAAAELDPRSAWQCCNDAAQTLVRARSLLLRSAEKAKGADGRCLHLLASLIDSLEFEVKRVRTRLEDEQ